MEQLQTLYLDRSHAVGGTGQYFVLIMYFLANASPTKPLDVATLNFVPTCLMPVQEYLKNRPLPDSQLSPDTLSTRRYAQPH